MVRVAINGVGRIGRATLKQLIDHPEFDLIAVNDLIPIDNLRYLIQYDTVYGRFNQTVKIEKDGLEIGDTKIQYLSEKEPSNLPWKDMDIDIVFECTGLFTKKEDCQKHLEAGAKRVILSAPAKSEDIPTVVPGANQAEPESKIISCASCTTNCITPIVEILGRRIGIKKAIMTTIHAYTSTQNIVDGPSKKIRRGRAGAQNFVPTSTGAAVATTKALPEYQGKFNGVAVRGPLPLGSIADLVFLMEKEVSVEEINSIFREEAESERYKGIVGVTEEPFVSSDIIKDDRASIIDLEMTQIVDGDLLKIMSWYDNEWGYVAQMLREAEWLSRSD